jgi:hypothetical protein
VCDVFEKTKPQLCPEDCKQDLKENKVENNSVTSGTENSTIKSGTENTSKSSTGTNTNNNTTTISKELKAKVDAFMKKIENRRSEYNNDTKFVQLLDKLLTRLAIMKRKNFSKSSKDLITYIMNKIRKYKVVVQKGGETNSQENASTLSKASNTTDISNAS